MTPVALLVLLSLAAARRAWIHEDERRFLRALHGPDPWSPPTTRTPTRGGGPR